MSVAKIKRDLGWAPTIRFEDGLLETIDWYRQHRSWWEGILFRSKTYRQYYKAHYVKRGAKGSSS